MSAAVLSVLLMSPPVAFGHELGTAAASSPRPAECRSHQSASGELWRRSRSPALGSYCDLLGRGYARLPREPQQALVAANAAASARPGEASPLLLAGRARLALGDAKGAWEAFQRVGSGQPALLQSPEVLHDFALAALLTGKVEQAREAYLRLVPRASLLSHTARRERVVFEAAVLAMHTGPEALKEATGLLTEARRSVMLPGFAPVVTAALALALDRAGKPERARALVGEIEGPRAISRWVRDEQAPKKGTVLTPEARAVVPFGEVDALVAIVAEHDDPAQALEAWKGYLQKVKSGPWVRHAQSKMSALSARWSKASKP